MSKTAFIFPGQGSQTVGMGVAIAEQYPQARALFDQAKEVLRFDLFTLCQSGPEEKLRETDIAQPALYVTGFATAAILRQRGVSAGALAGHSVGEYAALATAGVFGFKEGLALVWERGRLMKEAGAAKPGTMAAILGLSESDVRAVCAEASSAGVCVPVNFNTPEQIVIAGEQAGIERASTLAQAKGAKRIIPLNVAGAFHSPLMAEAAQRMAQRLSSITFQDAAVPVAMNVDGGLRTKGAEIREALSKQLDSAVQWVRTIENMKTYGITRFIECGSGRVLSGLLRRIDRQLESFATESAEALEETVKAFEPARRETL